MLAADVFRLAEEHDFTAAGAGTRTHVEDAVRSEHDLRIVLDHDERVAGVAQLVHDVDHASHVARMQADRRLVEHEERVDERRAERGRQVDALDFAARERARLAVEREIAQSHFAQVARRAQISVSRRSVASSTERGRVSSFRVERIEERSRSRNRQQHEIVHGEAGKTSERLAREFCVDRREAVLGRQHAVRVVMRAEPPCLRFALQPRAAARQARRIGAVLRKQHAHVHLVGFGFEPLEEARHAVPRAGPRLAPAHPLRLAFEHPVPVLAREIAPRRRAESCAFSHIERARHGIPCTTPSATVSPRLRAASSIRRARRGRNRGRSRARSRGTFSHAPSGELNENRLGVGSW